MERVSYVNAVMKAQVRKQIATTGRLNERTWGAVASQIVAADVASAASEKDNAFVRRVQEANGWGTMPAVDDLVLEYELTGLDLTQMFDTLELSQNYELHPLVTNMIKNELENKELMFDMGIYDLLRRDGSEQFEHMAHVVDSIYSLQKARDMVEGEERIQLMFEFLVRVEIPYGWATDRFEPTEHYFETAEEFADYVAGRTMYRAKQIELSDIEL